MTDTPRSLIDRYGEKSWEVSPFAASQYGIPGYDAEVPDASREGDEAWRSTLQGLLRDANAIATDEWSPADRITLECLMGSVERGLDDLDMRESEYTVTPMPFSGPAQLLAIAARTILADGQAAEDYITRLRRSGGWIDQLTQRLREGAHDGRYPVDGTTREAIGWVQDVLAKPVPEALLAPKPPQGWDGESAWREQLDEVGSQVVAPALARWLDVVRDELLPRARPDSQAGLTHLPGGDDFYESAIRLHTTLDVSAQQLHDAGLAEIERLEARARELGAQIGLDSLEAALDGVRVSSTERTPEEAIEAATEAIRRAESRAHEVFPDPLPPPCVVSPMPPVVGASGMAPHYTPPRLDGGRPGTYWYNTQRATAGAGWDLEAVAFHEAVPGHHLQLSRQQLLSSLPDVQRQRSITVFSEGWGLYAEILAEEMGLFSDVRQQLGLVATTLMRAARLVVDTGLHAFGWSRQQARQFFHDHVPMPEAFVASETDRYIIMPGQALAYQTGKTEILRLRQLAMDTLGESFSLPAFHSAVLDNGSLPMPVLDSAVQAWIAAG
jgi:uncharacterized protein (DUF885 family)